MPALVRLLQAYLARAPGEVVSRGYLQVWDGRVGKQCAWDSVAAAGAPSCQPPVPPAPPQAVLGVFQKLVASKAHDHEGFYVLNTLLESLAPEALAQVCARACGGWVGGRERVGWQSARSWPLCPCTHVPPLRAHPPRSTCPPSGACSSAACSRRAPPSSRARCLSSSRSTPASAAPPRWPTA